MRILVMSDLHTEFAGLQPTQVCAPCHEKFALRALQPDAKTHSGPCVLTATQN